MSDLIVKFTLECRTNKSGKLKKFKPNYVNKENYKFWKADSIRKELGAEISKENYATLSLLDNNFILYRYPTQNRFYSEDMIDMAFEALIDINSIVENSLNLSNRAMKVIKEVENEISVDKNKD